MTAGGFGKLCFFRNLIKNTQSPDPNGEGRILRNSCTGKIKITFEELLTGEPADKDPVYLPCSSCENTTNTCKVMYNVNGGE